MSICYTSGGTKKYSGGFPWTGRRGGGAAGGNTKIRAAVHSSLSLSLFLSLSFAVRNTVKFDHTGDKITHYHMGDNITPPITIVKIEYTITWVGI